MAKVLYAIPSRGRANRMLVLNYLPASVRKNLHIFVIEEELEAYEKAVPYAKCIPVPEWVDHIERKRLFMFKFAKLHGYDAVFMFDDDLSLAEWKPDIKRFRSVRKTPEDLNEFFAKTVPKLFDKAPGVGLGCKFMAEQKIERKGLEEVNGKMCCAFGYRVDEALEFIEWEQTYHLWNLDTMANLFFLTQGLPLLVHYGVTWSTPFEADDPKKGGCAIYRKQSVINEAFLRMIKYFPGLVSRKKKMSAHPTSFLQISWRNAYAHAIKMGAPVSDNAAYWSKKMGLKLPKFSNEYFSAQSSSARASMRLELAIQGKGFQHLDLSNKIAIKKITKIGAKASYSQLVPDLEAFMKKNPDLIPESAQEKKKGLFA